MTVLDLFAGPGGWDEGARSLGIRPIGFEWDMAACQTAMKAGHTRVRADVAQISTAPMVGKVTGLIASPPCQAWSMAGKRKGELDRQHCHDLAERMAEGDDSTDWTAWEDERSPLVCEPVRFVRDLRPEWAALEEVPAVASLWEHFALIFRRWGYSVWTGDLNSADYGVPQTRTRRILMASRVAQVQPPPPTHAQDAADDLFGGSTLPWVTMAQALGWGMTARPSVTVCGGSGMNPDGSATGGAQPFANMGRQAMRAEQRAGQWVHERPATTVVGSYCPDVISPPGYRLTESRQNAEGGVRVTVAEGGVLQSFPPDYPWQGSRTKQYQQVGNAIPPLLARHILGSLVGVTAAEAAA